MQHYDSNNNNVQRTLYESFLSKLIIENEKYYRPVFEKICKEIRFVIWFLPAYLQKSKQRPIGDFIISHSWCAELFDETYYEKNLYDFDLLVRYEDFIKEEKIGRLANFIKFFFEDYLVLELIDKIRKIKDKNVPSKTQPSNGKLLTLSQLCQKKLARHYMAIADLQHVLRPNDLFSEKGRGRFEINPDMESTTDLGIMAIHSTHSRLKNYFSEQNLIGNAKLYFKRNSASNFVKLLECCDIPFISGPSGTIANSLAGLFALAPLTPIELRQYAMGVAGVLVASGHHSFFECMVVFKVIGSGGFSSGPTCGLGFELHAVEIEKSRNNDNDLASFIVPLSVIVYPLSITVICKLSKLKP